MGVAPIIRRLAREAGQQAGLEPGEIYGRSNCRRLAWPRFAVMKVAREHGRSYHQIARYIGRDHSSVIYGVWRASILELGNPEFRALVAKLRAVR